MKTLLNFIEAATKHKLDKVESSTNKNTIIDETQFYLVLNNTVLVHSKVQMNTRGGKIKSRLFTVNSKGVTKRIFLQTYNDLLT